MKRYVKFLVLIVGVAVALSVGVYAYYLTLPRVSLILYSDSKLTGCKARLNETFMLHLKNDGTVHLYVNACVIDANVGVVGDVVVTYTFQSDIEIPVGVEAVITFPASGGKVGVETLSGPPGTVAGGGVYAVSDNPDPNPFPLVVETQIFIHTRSGVIGSGAGHGGFPIAFVP